METIRTRPNDILGNLSADQQQDLHHWLASSSSVDEIRKRIALPPPEGFGLKVSRATLRRFFAKSLPPHLREARNRELDIIRQQAILAATNPAPFNLVAIESMHRYLFELSINIKQNPQAFETAYKLMLKTEELKLKQQSALLAREKVEIQAAKATLANSSDLMAIFEQEALSESQKLAAIRQSLFGLQNSKQPLQIEAPGAPGSLPQAEPFREVLLPRLVEVFLDSTPSESEQK